MADDDLTKLFTDVFFSQPHPTDGPSPASPYSGLRYLQSRLGDRQPLLTNPIRLRTVLELSAMADTRLFFAMLLHHCMALGPALDFGAPPEDVAALASGQWIGAALMDERAHGNSSSAIRTQAVFDAATREFVLHTPTPEAAKQPNTAGLDGFAKLAVVSARLLTGGTDRGTALFLVPLRDENGPCEGVTIEPFAPNAPLPMDFAKVRFDRVRVPYRRWLGDGASIADDGSFHDPLDGPESRSRRSVGMSRFAFGAVTAGLAATARASTALALTHARHRRTNDRLAGDIVAIAHLNQQRLLFGAAADALAATAVAHRTTARSWHIPPGGGLGTGPSAAEMRTLSLNKVAVAELADTAVSRCRAASGSLSFFPEHRMIGYQALTTAFQAGGGDNRLILLDAAWSMATGPEYRPPDEESVPDDWSRLFRAGERLLHAELVSALRTDGDQAVRFESWNARTELAERLARAHATRTTAEALRETLCASDSDSPDAAQPLLRDLYRLHCLQQATPHTGWYLAHGLLTPQQVLALPERINEICRRLLPHAEALTELLDVPAGLLLTVR